MPKDCSHKVVINSGDRTLCMLCNQSLKYNKETRKHEVIPPPDTLTKDDKIVTQARKGILESMGEEE